MYGRLSARLHHLGFVPYKADTLLFIFTQHGVQIYMLVSIYDIVIPGSTPAANDHWLHLSLRLFLSRILIFSRS
jgi:hypothetical protein